MCAVDVVLKLREDKLKECVIEGLQHMYKPVDERGFVPDEARWRTGMLVVCETKLTIVDEVEFEEAFGMKPLKRLTRRHPMMKVNTIDASLRVVWEDVFCFKYDPTSQHRSAVIQLYSDVENKRYS